MPKAATQASTKAAAKTANTRTAKAPKEPKEEKVKRAPSAYNQFMKDKLPQFKADNPEMDHKEAFKGVAALWKDAPENPKRGQETVSRPKKKSAEDKENAASKPKPKSKPKKKEEVVEESDEENGAEVDSDE